MFGLFMNFKNIFNNSKYTLKLSIIFTIVVILIGRPYNLLVNDDGIFIRNVKNFYDETFYLHPLTAPTFYFQAITGFITTKLFGFSFEILRILNITLAFFSSILTFIFLKKTTKNQVISLIVTLTFIANPFFWFLSYSYMTEIHFFFLASVSLLVFLTYLKNTKLKNAIYLSIVLSLLFLVRQIGLLFTISFILSIFIVNKKLTKKDLSILIFPTLVFLWYQYFSKTAEYSEAGIVETVKNFFDYSFMTDIFAKRVFDSAVYIGLFTLPVIPVILFNKNIYKNTINKTKIIIVTIIITPFILKLGEKVQNHFTFPTLPNVFTLKGFYPSAIPSSDRFVNYPLFYNLHTSLLIIGVISFILLIKVFVFKFNIYTKLNQNQKIIYLAGLFNLLFITAITLAFRAVYDRYIFLIFFLLLVPISYLLNFKLNFLSKTFSLCIIMSFFIISIVFEKDYISWNHKRNEIITYATKTYNQNICDLEGIGEWEDYLYYDCKDIQDKLKKNLRISWQDSDNIEGKQYIKLKEFKFKSYLGKQENKLYLLQKVTNEN